MIISLQALCTFVGQTYSSWDATKQATATRHIRLAGAEVRGALMALYSIPTYTRDASGAITAPSIAAGADGWANDPVNTALGPIVSMLAAAFLINPARGFQPQEERDAASAYRKAARDQLMQLQNGDAFVAPLAGISAYGITLTSAGTALFTARNIPNIITLGVPSDGLFGALRTPDGS